MSTLQRQHFGLQYNAGGLPFVRGRVGIIPSQEAKGPRWPAQDAHACYILQDSFITVAIEDAIEGNPDTAPVTGEAGAVVSRLTNGGAHIVGPARIPQAVGTEIDMTQAWTVWTYITVHPDSGADVWPILQDHNYYSEGHGFLVLAQSYGSTADGDSMILVVRMLVDGATDFTSQFQVPANDRWTYGKAMLLSLTHDGFGNVTMQIFSSNGLVSAATKSFDMTEGTGPIGSKTNVTRWSVGGSAFPSPARDVECWGVLQRQWSNDDALLAYRASRALALQRGRPGT